MPSDYMNLIHLSFLSVLKVSKNVAAACVGAKNLHTAQHWLQKTGQCARNLLQVFMNFWLYP